MQTGMAVKDDGESSREEGNQRIMDIALKAVYEGTGKGNWVLREERTEYKGGKDANLGGKSSEWPCHEGRRRNREKVTKVSAEHAGLVATQGTSQPCLQKAATRS